MIPAGAAPPVLLAGEAMATRFELVLHGSDPARLRAAGEEALRLIQQLDARLSCYRATSDVSRINARATSAAVPVEGELFELLLEARRLHVRSNGAFDITIGPLLQCWGLVGRGGGRVPDALTLERARARTGMDLVELDERRRTVRFTRPGMAIDLGAIGKGYALGQAAQLLRELGVASALLHGGTSSVCAIGAPPGADAWQVAIEYPALGTSRRSDSPRGPDDVLAIVPLVDRSLSVSAVWGKAFVAGDVRYGHVLDPRAGRPVDGALLAAVVCDDATAADALSTALLVLGPDGHEPVTAADPDLAALVLAPADDSAADPARAAIPVREPTGRYRTWSRGITVRPRPAGSIAANVA